MLSAIEACVKKAGNVDGWFHLGDYAWDSEKLSELTDKPILTIYGNCDGYASRDFDTVRFGNKPIYKASERVVEVEDTKLFLCHGHYYEVDLGLWELSYRAREFECRAALFGHTHRPDLSVQGSVLMLNPGSPSRPRGGAPRSFAILSVDGRDINAEIITLDR